MTSICWTRPNRHLQGELMGASATYVCSGCGFESDEVLVGVGMMGVEQRPAACPSHRGMTTLASRYPTAPHQVELSEAERTQCGECGAEPVLLVGPEPWVCPVCGEIQLREIPGLALWD